jgi:hypothetical protein
MMHGYEVHACKVLIRERQTPMTYDEGVQRVNALLSHLSCL